MKEIKSVEVRDDKITLKIEDRDSWGTVRRRQQMTFRRRHFEAMLRKAEIVVPWDQVKQD